MTSFSFDWNCVIEVEADGEHACQVRRLIELHRSGACEVSVLATSASENLRGSRTLPGSYDHFRKRLEALGWSDLSAVPTLFAVGLTFIGSAKLAGNHDDTLIDALWQILAPNIERAPRRYCPPLFASDEDWIASKELAKYVVRRSFSPFTHFGRARCVCDNEHHRLPETCRLVGPARTAPHRLAERGRHPCRESLATLETPRIAPARAGARIVPARAGAILG
jgi:hypothetical protein